LYARTAALQLCDPYFVSRKVDWRFWHPAPKKSIELELELIQTQMAQKPMLRAEVGMRVRCAIKASAE
jgi:aspartate carbamoyltransferase catalytic subunit